MWNSNFDKYTDFIITQMLNKWIINTYTANKNAWKVPQFTKNGYSFTALIKETHLSLDWFIMISRKSSPRKYYAHKPNQRHTQK